jgi:hypothetical protein
LAVKRQPFKVLIPRLHLEIGRWLCLLALAVDISTQLAPASSPAQTNAPVITFLSPIYYFGTALTGDPVEHVFEFTNAGNGPLEILGVYPGCSCTFPGEWTKQVAPGHTGRVALFLDTSRFDGPIAEATVVASNDRAHFNVSLQFRGTVHKPVELIPRTVVFKPATVASASQTNVTRIISHLPEPIVLEAPVSDNPLLTAELKTITPGKEYQLFVRMRGRHDSSISQGKITIKTNSARVPLIEVPVLVAPAAGPVGQSKTAASGASAADLPNLATAHPGTPIH